MSTDGQKLDIYTDSKLVTQINTVYKQHTELEAYRRERIS